TESRPRFVRSAAGIRTRQGTPRKRSANNTRKLFRNLRAQFRASGQSRRLSFRDWRRPDGRTLFATPGGKRYRRLIRQAVSRTENGVDRDPSSTGEEIHPDLPRRDGRDAV